ncbi:hypothetical protein EI94DRAFT_1836480 [Lactarius quietus]|nr:hypothetical protein EI94DRAFT_1836480 [Lactarius quietus]
MLGSLGSSVGVQGDGARELEVIRKENRERCIFISSSPTPNGVLDGTAAPVRNQFPFAHKLITLDRDRIVVPARWDSWGKIALRDATALTQKRARKLYSSLMQDSGPKPPPPLNKPTPEQGFLAKKYDENARQAYRNPRGIFHTPNDASAPPAAGLVGPLGSSPFSLPTVERALREMEGSCAGATVGLGAMQHEVSKNRFKSLPNPKDRAASPGASAVSPGTVNAAGKPTVTGPRTSRGSGSGGASASGDSQTVPDAGSGTEDE